LRERETAIEIILIPSLPTDQSMDQSEEGPYSWSEMPSYLLHGPDPINDQAQHRDEARDGKDICRQTSGVHD
jgi:hypothetical protein